MICGTVCKAILQARIKRVVYAARENKFGAAKSIINVFDPSLKFNHHVDVKGGVLEEASSNMLKEYFRNKRSKAKKE